MFQLGIERLLRENDLQKKLTGKRLAFLGHPASVTQDLRSSLDQIAANPAFNVVVAFGPQHGMRGEKQDNMIESEDYRDPTLNIPVYSLYGKVRRPTPQMLEGWDVLLVDLQDVGCRIYTFLTTLFYMMDAVEAQYQEAQYQEDRNQENRNQKGRSQEIWVLDRPNPAGREVEGHTLDMELASFVGAAPVPMRHGLTLGEAALWYREFKGYKSPLTVVHMNHYHPHDLPGYGWPDMGWVNPSPNMPSLATARTYCGTVLFEGTTLSEGRGTTTPLEIFGAPGLRIPQILDEMKRMSPKWLEGCVLRPAFFEPTFHKFKGELVHAVQVHVDGPFYNPKVFKPYRLATLFLKCTQKIHPDLDLWRKPPYEYETTLMPIDILSGNGRLREWVADSSPGIREWDDSLAHDERAWVKNSKPHFLY